MIYIDNVIKDYGLYIIIIESIILLVLIIWIIFFDNDNSEEIESIKQENKSLRKQLTEANRSLKHSNNLLNQVKARLNQWEEWYSKNRYIYEKFERNREESSESIFSRNEKVNQDRYKYLEEAIGGRFMSIKSNADKCYFRTWEENGVRKFEFFGNTSKALANINAIFDGVCDIDGKHNGATEIENISPGSLNSDLVITNKAKIRLK